MKTLTLFSLATALASGAAFAQTASTPAAGGGTMQSSAMPTTSPDTAGAQTVPTPAAGGGITQSSATPAPGSAAAAVTVGASVADPQGGAVGTIDAVTGDLATLNTGTNKVQLPSSSFAKGANGLVIAMTKAEVDAAASGAADKAKADLAASLKPGIQVSDTKGGVAGTIEAADAQFVTVATANSKVKLPISAFAAGASGPVIAMTAAELDAAAKGATPGGER